jgi:hypothetical protein
MPLDEELARDLYYLQFDKTIALRVNILVPTDCSSSI